MRPPMALQYGIWALASKGHPKCKSYHEVFYRGTRKYIDEDEMKYWERHRDIDNTISNVFMFLPEAARLPGNYRDPAAVITNLNLHTCVICLHHSVIDRVEAHKLPDHIKKLSHDRLSTAAQETVNIIRSKSHMSTSASPLAALSLYCAASVYIYFGNENKASTNVVNLDSIISAMEAIGRDHALTRAFLRQVLLDIDHNGIGHMVRTPRLDRVSEALGAQMSNDIPLLARSGISRHTDVQPPLPGRLPLGRPVGKVIREESSEAGPALGRLTAFPTVAWRFCRGHELASPNGLARRQRQSAPEPRHGPADGRGRTVLVIIVNVVPAANKRAGREHKLDNIPALRAAAAQDNNPRRRTNLDGWDMASVRMYTQFLHGDNDERGGGEGSKGNPCSLEAANEDWSLFATDGRERRRGLSGVRLGGIRPSDSKESILG
ncbi:hypothetical protein DL767_004681 [Monosporascus sp. MG133]|nr:hypothetical protein DL767_004681 [Monosporascus sp. MG133]